jgi:hypothetical protein
LEKFGKPIKKSKIENLITLIKLVKTFRNKFRVITIPINFFNFFKILRGSCSLLNHYIFWRIYFDLIVNKDQSREPNRNRTQNLGSLSEPNPNRNPNFRTQTRTGTQIFKRTEPRTEPLFRFPTLIKISVGHSTVEVKTSIFLIRLKFCR